MYKFSSLKNTILVILMCLFSQTACAQTSKVTSIAIKSYKSVIDCNSEALMLHINISVQDVRGLNLLYPPILLCDDPVADMSYSIEKLDDSAKKYITYKYMIDEMPIREKYLIHLKKGESFFISKGIPCLFREMGKFRVKVTLNISDYNKGQQNISSNWCKFKILIPVKYPQ